MIFNGHYCYKSIVDQQFSSLTNRHYVRKYIYSKLCILNSCIKIKQMILGVYAYTYHGMNFKCSISNFVNFEQLLAHNIKIDNCNGDSSKDKIIMAYNARLIGAMHIYTQAVTYNVN